MAGTARLPADRQLIVYERFDERLKAHLRSLVSDALIDEHRRRPLGQHSDDLERVLNYYRRPPKYALYSPLPFKEYRVIALPVDPAKPPLSVDDTVYRDQDEALHAVFLKQVEALRAG